MKLEVELLIEEPLLEYKGEEEIGNLAWSQL